MYFLNGCCVLETILNYYLIYKFVMVCVPSYLSNNQNLDDRETYGKSVLDIKCASSFSTTSFRSFFAPINI